MKTSTLIDKTLETRFFTGKHPAIEVTRAAAPSLRANGSRLVVVVGENASGKSFLRRVIQAVNHKNKIESIHLSMEGRKNQYMGMLVYGDEATAATSCNSIYTVTTGISTCKSRKEPHVIIWDEPEIGLSDGVAMSVAQAIVDYVSDPNPHTVAAVVITHRKAFVEVLAKASPEFLYVGSTKGPTLQGWLDEKPELRPLEEVLEIGRERRVRIQKLLNESMAKRRTK